MENLYYLIPYLVLLLSSLVVFLKVRNDNARVFIISFMILFSALRYNVGWDYPGYLRIILGDCSDNEFYRFELIPRLLVVLSRSLEFAQFFFISTAFLTIYLVSFVVRRLSLNPSLSVFAYLCIPILFLSSMSTVRYHLALSCSLVFWYYLTQKKVGMIVLCGGIMIFCHYSSLIVLLILPLWYFRFSRWTNIVFFILSMLVTSFTHTYLLNLLGGEVNILSYYLLSASNVGFSKLPILLSGINIVNLIFYKKIDAVDRMGVHYLMFYNVGCCIMNVMSFQPTFSYRLSTYYLLFIILILPYYLIAFKQKIVKQIIVAFLCSFFMLYHYTTINAYVSGDMEKNEFLPYQIFLNK